MIYSYYLHTWVYFDNEIICVYDEYEYMYTVRVASHIPVLCPWVEAKIKKTWYTLNSKAEQFFKASDSGKASP